MSKPTITIEGPNGALRIPMDVLPADDDASTQLIGDLIRIVGAPLPDLEVDE